MTHQSNLSSIDTVALTKSFGWEGSEVFQQQDVQELCRVLFDALEDAFRGTDVDNMIDQLYAGELVDYLKCVGVDYQSDRRDKFLDYSLTITPYGSNTAMKSIHECIEYYLQPEILDGDNQYFVESIGKKVDAIKGLKFGKLPQIMAVQLKRFVYDFSGEQVVHKKINDEVKFPFILDMNKYVAGNGTSDGFEKFLAERIEQLRRKRSSSSDGAETKASDTELSSGRNADDRNDPNMPDLVDCNGKLCIEQLSEQLKNNVVEETEEEKLERKFYHEDGFTSEEIQELMSKNGPWIYELFAVMIHQGAIAG